MPFEVLQYVVLLHHVNAELLSLVNVVDRVNVNRVLTDHQAGFHDNLNSLIVSKLVPLEKESKVQDSPGWDGLFNDDVQQEIEKKNKSEKIPVAQVAQSVLQIVFCFEDKLSKFAISLSLSLSLPNQNLSIVWTSYLSGQFGRLSALLR